MPTRGVTRAVSLVDTARRHELLYARAQSIQFSLVSSELEHEGQLTIESLQADNMLRSEERV